MPVLRHEVDVPWMPLPNEVVLESGDVLPPRETITAAFVFAFSGDRLLFANLVRRGLEIPGGHLEPGESPEDAAVREAREETGARVRDLKPLAWQRHEIRAPRPEGYPFPYPTTHMVFFVGRVQELNPFVPDDESLGRQLLTRNEADRLPWVERSRTLFEVAWAMHQTSEDASPR